jgi:hypothetical protein
MPDTHREHRVNRLLGVKDEVERAAWGRGPLDAAKGILRSDIETDFGKWLDFEMAAAHATNLDVALSYNDFRYLRPRGSDDHRFKGTSINVHPPKKEISEYKRGLRVPGPIVAYRIGRALEQLFVRRHLANNQERLRKIGARGGAVPETVSGAVCSLDALVVAGYWADAIACVGTFFGRSESATFRWDVDFGDTLERRLRGETFPTQVYPRLDYAWITWITDHDVTKLPPRFAAAHILATSSEDRDQITAADILQEWSPRRYLDLEDSRRSGEQVERGVPVKTATHRSV